MMRLFFSLGPTHVLNSAIIDATKILFYKTFYFQVAIVLKARDRFKKNLHEKVVELISRADAKSAMLDKLHNQTVKLADKLRSTDEAADLDTELCEEYSKLQPELKQLLQEKPVKTNPQLELSLNGKV